MHSLQQLKERDVRHRIIYDFLFYFPSFDSLARKVLNVVTVNETILQLANEMFDDLKPHEKRIKISKVCFRLFPQAATSSRFRCRQWLLAVSSKHKSHDLISSLAQHFILFAFVPFAFSKMSSFCLSCGKQSWRKIEPRSALHVFHFLKASESPSCDFFRKSVDRDVLWPE